MTFTPSRPFHPGGATASPYTLDCSIDRAHQPRHLRLLRERLLPRRCRDDRLATKLSVGIVPAEDAEPTDLRRWLSERQADIRADNRVAKEVLAFITEAGAKSVVMTDRIIGCPHEKGIHYEGLTCPVCSFWAGRDRWTGKRLQ